MKKGKSTRVLSLALFIPGVLIGFIFLVLTVWADFEAFLFDSQLSADRTFTSLRCPILISTEEYGSVSASVHNPLDWRITLRIRTHISDGIVTLFREEDNIVSLEPGQSQDLEWTVTPSDAAYNLVALVRVYLFRNHPLPSRVGSCGVLVVDTAGLSGNLAVALIMISSLSFMLVGWRLWTAHISFPDLRVNHITQGMRVLTGAFAISMLSTLLGWWLLSAFFLVVIILMIIEIIAYLARSA